MRHSRSIVTAINEKTPGFDRSALTLRQRHPILVGDLLDTQSHVWCAICGVFDQRKQRIAGRSLGEMGEDLEASLGSKVSSSARAIRSAAASSVATVAW